SPAQSVDVAVRHAEPEACEHNFAHVRFAIAISVFQKENVGRGSHEDPSVPRSGRGRETEVLRKDGAAIDLPVAIQVFEQPDGAARTALGPDPKRVITHLDDVNPTVFVESNGDWIDDVRFGSEKFHGERRMQLKAVGVTFGMLVLSL